MPTLPTRADEYRDEALRRLQAGKDYEFLALAVPYLEQCPDDRHVRLVAARTYLALGLIVPARDLLDAGATLPGAPDELRAVRESLLRVDRPPLSWGAFAQTFERNLEVLGHGVNVSHIRNAGERLKRDYQLFRDSNEQWQVRERSAGGWRWFPIIGHHVQDDEKRELPDGVGSQMPGPYLFEGVGLGRYFERIYNATQNTFLNFSCALLVVEPEPARMAVALHLNDWSRLLADPRVYLLTGADWARRLPKIWEENWDLPIPRQVIAIGARRVAELRPVDILHEAATSRERLIVESIDDLEERYRERTAEYWAGRFADALDGRGEGLRILAGVSIHTTFLQHSMRDAKRAFESLGHQCLVISEKNNHLVVGPLTYHEAIRQFDPDVFFCIDHLRPEFGALLPRNLPVLTWDQDALPHVLTQANLAGMAAHDFLVTCGKFRCLELGVKPDQCMIARVPTSPEQFGGPPLTDAERRKYECDVSYVSHASQTPREFYLDERRRYPQPELQRLLDAICAILPARLARTPVPTGYMMEQVLDEAMTQCELQVRDEDLRSRLTCWYIWRLADRIFRHEALEWVAAWAKSRGAAFRIYGNGWEKHPTLSPFAAGPAHNGRELLCVYRASRINLQLMPAGFIHQRSLDGLAAGGFFLTRLAPQDVKGPALRRLQAAFDRLGIRSNDDLRSCRDAELQRLVTEYLGHPPDAKSVRDLRTVVQVNAELEYADEVFSDFRDIAFASAESFARLADRFLGDAAGRATIARRMREIVVEKFSYRPTMDSLLLTMASYLTQVEQLRSKNSPGRGARADLL